MQKNTKFILIAGIGSIAISWFVGGWLESVVGTFAWVAPGIVTVSAIMVGQKLSKSKSN